MALRFERSPGWDGNSDSVSGSDPAVEKVNLKQRLMVMYKNIKYYLTLFIQTVLLKNVSLGT